MTALEKFMALAAVQCGIEFSRLTGLAIGSGKKGADRIAFRAAGELLRGFTQGAYLRLHLRLHLIRDRVRQRLLPFSGGVSLLDRLVAVLHGLLPLGDLHLRLLHGRGELGDLLVLRDQFLFRGLGGLADGIDGVSAYAVNASNGSLTLIQTSGGQDFFPAGTTPVALAGSPNGDFLYVANFGSSNVSGYRIGADGRLTALTGSPFAAGTNPVSLSVDPSGSFLYVANQGGGVSIFTIASTTGVLSSGGTATAGTTPSSVVATQ